VNEITVYGDIYEFGIYGGKSLEYLLFELKKNNISYNKIYGFDSFEGLPKEKEDFVVLTKYKHPLCTEGSFNAQKLYNKDKDFGFT
jgi:hypothetical protein